MGGACSPAPRLRSIFSARPATVGASNMTAQRYLHPEGFANSGNDLSSQQRVPT